MTSSRPRHAVAGLVFLCVQAVSRDLQYMCSFLSKTPPSYITVDEEHLDMLLTSSRLPKALPLFRFTSSNGYTVFHVTS